MNAQPRIFFARSYSYRKTSALIGGLAALGFGVFACGMAVLEFSRATWSWSALGTAVLVGGIGAALGCVGFWIVRQWMARTSLRLEISDAGVRYGKTRHSWEAIHWLSGHSEGTDVTLFYQTRGRALARFNRSMPVDPNLTREEFHELMNQLEIAISGRHPEVQFGWPGGAPPME